MNPPSKSQTVGTNVMKITLLDNQEAHVVCEKVLPVRKADAERLSMFIFHGLAFIAVFRLVINSHSD